MVNKRSACALLAVGLLGVCLYPHVLAPHAPAFLRTDFGTGVAMGIFLGLEIWAARLLFRSRCRSGCGSPLP